MAAQGRGIGHQLMERCCEQLDRSGEAAYLETYRPENVKFYARFDFETTAEIPVLGARSYLMWRKPKSNHRRLGQMNHGWSRMPRIFTD
jgi:ribosomal protein S18 acetylase RimI-like enzyme